MNTHRTKTPPQRHSLTNTLYHALYAAVLICFLAVLIASAVAQTQPASESSSPAQATLDIFQAKCSQCHNPQAKSRKAIKAWPDTSDLEFLRLKYIEPANRNPQSAEESTLWLILTDEPEHRMPPQDAKAGQLTAAELSSILAWIKSGAPTINPASPTHEPVQPSTQTTAPLAFTHRLVRWLGRFHPAAVHTPIGLLLAAGAAQLLWWATRRPGFDSACRFCVLFGAVTALPAACLGLSAGWFHSQADPTLSIHRWLGLSLTASAILTAVLNELTRYHPFAKAKPLVRIAVLVNAALVGLTGHFGGLLVYGPEHYAW